MDNKALFKLSYGMAVLTAKDGAKDNGCIIDTAIQVATNPNQLCISVHKENYTNDMILKTNEFNVSVISEKATFELFKHFGFQSGKNVDKFADFKACKRSSNGIYYITEGTNAFFSVKVKKTEDLGSHTLYIGEITDMEVLCCCDTATYDYYHKKIKSLPDDASKKEDKEKVMWHCTICGCEYEGEELPEDYMCPVCNHSAPFFVKIFI